MHMPGFILWVKFDKWLLMLLRWQQRCWPRAAWPSITTRPTLRVNQSNRKPSENHFLTAPPCQMPFLGSKEASPPLHPERKCIFPHPPSPAPPLKPIARKRCMVAQEWRGAGGAEGRGGVTMAKGQWNYINLSECIWSLAFDRNREGE